MVEDNAERPDLAAVAHRYPEKTLLLGQVFNDTTNSYKLIWFLGLLSLIRRSATCSFRLADIFAEATVFAWNPVCLYRLSLGKQDKLQDVIVSIQRASGLTPNARPEVIRDFIRSSDAAQASLDYLRRFVPTRFLAPWFADRLRGMRDDKKKKTIEILAAESQTTPSACPYWLDGRGDDPPIRLNDSWRAFFTENMAVIQAFAEHHFALYLQARNPNVPGVLNKLHAPTERQLTTARHFWRFVQHELAITGRAPQFKDIYTERQLEDHYAIDHFLPWRFVVHDLLWNLVPVEQLTNSKKGDVLPDLTVYLPRLAKLHFCAIEIAKNRPKLLEDYTDCFKADTDDLLALGEEGFAAKYQEIVVPQVQIAMNQGFQSGWRFSTRGGNS